MLSVYANNIAGLLSVPQSYTGGPAPTNPTPLSLATPDVSVSKDAVVTPFSQMTADRRSTIQKVADVATSVLGALGVNIQGQASGSGIYVSTAPTAGTAAQNQQEEAKPLYENPLFIGGAVAIVAVLLLRK